MAGKSGPDIVDTGLVLVLDAANKNSYPGTGTNWKDLSGNNKNETLTNGPTFSATNLGGITFDGTNDYVDLSANSNLLNLGNTFTIESVFKLTNTSQTIGTIFSSLDVATSSQTKGVSFHWYKTAEYGLSANILRVQLGLATWAWNIFGSNGISITDTNYHHVAVTIASGNTSPVIVFYIDGVSQSATRWNDGTTGALNYGSDANSLRLGSRYPASNPGYDTSYSALTISILKIYNRTFSASEVLQNYNATKTRFGY